MRENIGIYRGKVLDTGEWIYGNLLTYPKGYAEISPLKKDINCFYDVDPITVGEFTSKVDKNGKRIFEGDIVKEYGIAVVEYYTEDVASCGCCYPSFNGVGFKADDVDLDCCEVIGNIYDNPELVEQIEEDYVHRTNSTT